MALTDEQIVELLATGKTRGLYKTELGNFLKGGEKGVEVDLTAGVFKGSKVDTVKQGFENAKNAKNAPDGADQIVVKKVNDRVFLINQALVTG